MVLPRKITSSLMLAAALVPASLYAQALGPAASRLQQELNQAGPAIPDTYAAALPDRPVTAKEGKSVLFPELDRTIELSPMDLDNLSENERIMLRYIWEEKQLESIRQLLRDHARASELEKQKRSLPTPEEIREFRNVWESVEKAKNEPLTPPEMRIRTIALDIHSSEPLKLHVVDGYASTIVFQDATGAPWPLQDEGVLGDQDSFESFVAGEAKNQVVFSIKRHFAQSNALINLQGLATSVVVQLIGGSDIVDTRLTASLPAMGPEARQAPIQYDPFPDADPAVFDFMNSGHLPDGVPYRIVGVEGEAVLYGGMLYVRTKHTLKTPPPLNAATSLTGMNVYKVDPTADLLISVDGNLVEAKVEPVSRVTVDRAPSPFQQGR